MRNKFSLADLARGDQGQLRRRRPVTLRRVPSPRTQEGRARQIGRRIVAAWSTAVRDSVLPAYEQGLQQLTKDAAGDPVRDALSAAETTVTRLVLSSQESLRQWSIRVEEMQRNRFTGAVRAGTGVNVSPFLNSTDVEDEVAAALQRHSSLIRGLAEDQRSRVEETVWREFERQTPRGQVGKLLSRQLDIGRKRANLIARDQTAKLSSALDRARQQQAGIEKFRWRTAEDEKVRDRHVELNGQVFSWDDPPADEGFPGDPVNCRCKAEAVVEFD